jgi:NAD(P)H dehydrogenase (quinone)
VSPIAVTGATGGVGSRVVHHLLARAGRPPVVALARRPDAVPVAEGLTVRHADYDDPGSLRVALAGVDTLVFISSDGVAETMRRHHEHVVAAAVAAAVGHVIYTSILDIAPDSRFYYSPPHQDTEARLAASGLRHCCARTSIFADYFVQTWLEPARASGTLAINAGDGRMSLVTREDTAAALAAAALARREGVIDITGPEALTGAEIAAIAGVAHEPLGEAEYRRRLAADGNPGWLVDAFSSMFRSVVEERFATVSPDVPDLTGRPRQRFAGFLAGDGGASGER